MGKKKSKQPQPEEYHVGEQIMQSLTATFTDGVDIADCRSDNCSQSARYTRMGTLIPSAVETWY